MTTELSLASIRQGEIAAAHAWEMLAPMIDTEDQALATRICDVLRSWTWKTLDRRRRDPALREWVDLLNRVEAFFSSRFERLAAKIELLAELVHESLAVAELASSQDLQRRKHVAPILQALSRRGSEWVERGDLMNELRLRPANMTRLMSLLLDAGWVEQAMHGREAAYRISAEGGVYARLFDVQALSALNTPLPEFDDRRASRIYPLLIRDDVRRAFIGKTTKADIQITRNQMHHEVDQGWRIIGQMTIKAIELDSVRDLERPRNRLGIQSPTLNLSVVGNAG